MITHNEGVLLLAVVSLVALLLLGMLGVEIHHLFAEITRDMQLTQVGS